LSDKPDSWDTDMMSIEPDKLYVGERKLVISCVGVTVGIIGVGIWRYGETPWWPVFAAVGLAMFVASMSLVARAWKVNPWLTAVYSRYRRYPSFIPAHTPIGAGLSFRSRTAYAFGARHHRLYTRRPQLKRTKT
jgi:type IV secretory pathway TrbD component